MANKTTRNDDSSGELRDIPEDLKILISTLALIFLIIHFFIQQITIDNIALFLLVFLIFPWILPYIKEITLLGVLSIKTRELEKTQQYPIPQMEQIVDTKTAKLFPPKFEITQDLPRGLKRKFPDVGFNIENPNNSPIIVTVSAEALLGEEKLAIPTGYYTGETSWNLNPLTGVRGHFALPDKAVKSTETLLIKIKVTYENYEKTEKHTLLPVGYVYMRKENSWYFEP